MQKRIATTDAGELQANRLYSIGYKSCDNVGEIDTIVGRWSGKHAATGALVILRESDGEKFFLFEHEFASIEPAVGKITIAPARCHYRDALRRTAEWIVDHGGTIAADDSELLTEVSAVLRARGLDDYAFDCGDVPGRQRYDVETMEKAIRHRILPPWKDTPETRLDLVKTRAREEFFQVETDAASSTIDNEFRPSEAKSIRRRLANVAQRFDWLAGEGFDWPFRKEAYAE